MLFLEKLPLGLRRFLAKPYQDFIFKKAMKKFISEVSSAEGVVSDSTIISLVYGWGNHGYSAQTEYLKRILYRVETSESEVLECGSGLSTLLMAIAGHKKGVVIHCLEENEFWYKKMSRELEKYSITNVHLYLASVKSYGEYLWYLVPDHLKNHQFSLVICDGPSDKSGTGRYGLLPIMKSSLKESAIILFDDYKETYYKNVLNRWISEFNVKVINKQLSNHFVEIVLPPFHE